MRHLSILLPALLFACADLSGQEDYSNARFLKMAEVEGTRYIITYMNDGGKFLKGPGASYVLFIDTVSEEVNRVDFPDGTLVDRIEQIYIPGMDINLIMVVARAKDNNGKNGIDYQDPRQIIIISPDGKGKHQLTPDDYFVDAWAVNKASGSLTVTGYYDKNNNNRYDEGKDTCRIHVHDLKKLSGAMVR